MNSSTDDKPVVVKVKCGVWRCLIGMVAGAGLTALYYEWGRAAIEQAFASPEQAGEKIVVVHSMQSCEALGKIAQQEAEKIRKKEAPLREAERARREADEKERLAAEGQKQGVDSPIEDGKAVAGGESSKDAGGEWRSASTDELIGHVRTVRGAKFDEIKEELRRRAEQGDARAAAVFSFLTDSKWGARLPNMDDPTLKRADKKEYHQWTVERLWREVQTANPKEVEWIKQELRSRAEEKGDIMAKNMYEAICIFHGIGNTAVEKPEPRIRRVMPEPVVCLAEMPPDFYDNWSTERLCMVIRATRPGAKDFKPMLTELKKRAAKGEAVAQEVVEQMKKRDG